MYDELVKSLRVCGRMTSIDDNCISYVNGCCEAFPDCAYALMDQAADAIEALNMELLNAKEFSDYADAIKEMKPKWIPVTERLPESNKRDSDGFAVMYLVMWGRRMVTARRTNDWWVLITGMVIEGVTHWMPLPEPPKEETC